MRLKREGENIANYLITHYKGTYRLLTPYDLKTKQFPREFTGQFAENDVYIKCQKDVKIFYYGKSLLEVYIPSLQRGRNIIKAINKELGKDVIQNIQESDSEVIFKVHAKYMKELEQYVKPIKNGANISPYSSKNLPKTKYKIPDKELNVYKYITDNIPKNSKLGIAHTTKKFIESLVTKKNSYDNILADMAMKGLKGKEYIHSIGKWEEYIQYLKENII